MTTRRHTRSDAHYLAVHHIWTLEIMSLTGAEPEQARALLRRARDDIAAARQLWVLFRATKLLMYFSYNAAADYFGWPFEEDAL